MTTPKMQVWDSEKLLHGHHQGDGCKIIAKTKRNNAKLPHKSMRTYCNETISYIVALTLVFLKYVCIVQTTERHFFVILYCARVGITLMLMHLQYWNAGCEAPRAIESCPTHTDTHAHYQLSMTYAFRHHVMMLIEEGFLEYLTASLWAFLAFSSQVCRHASPFHVTLLPHV